MTIEQIQKDQEQLAKFMDDIALYLGVVVAPFLEKTEKDSSQLLQGYPSGYALVEWAQRFRINAERKQKEDQDVARVRSMGYIVTKKSDTLEGAVRETLGVKDDGPKDLVETFLQIMKTVPEEVQPVDANNYPGLPKTDDDHHTFPTVLAD
jgi:hypothetical protein